MSRLITSAVGRLTRAMPALRPAQDLLERVTRFAGVGAASSLAYAGAVTLATTGLRITPDLSALLAYAVTLPFSFLMHRHFTFRSADEARSDLVRYAVAQGIGIAVSLAAMVLSVDLLGLPYGFGIVGAVTLVPVVSYLLMDRWVFARKAG